MCNSLEANQFKMAGLEKESEQAGEPQPESKLEASSCNHQGRLSKCERFHGFHNLGVWLRRHQAQLMEALACRDSNSAGDGQDNFG
jgi:hypothetical protein